MRVAVIGGGNGALAVACEWGLAGHEVTMAAPTDYPGSLPDVAAAGGITGTGQINGFAPVTVTGDDFGAALEGADLVQVVGAAFATEDYGRSCGPHLRPGMTVVVNPGSCLGALAFARAAGLPAHQDEITIAELSTLPYATRVIEDATVHVFHLLRGGLFVAALGQTRTEAVREMLAEVWPAVTTARSVWQTALQNGNPVIHPAVTLLNAALIERTGGDFLFYEEGVTQATGRVMAAVDAERIAIAEALGVQILSEPAAGVAQGYMLEDNYDTGYSTAPGFLGIKAQDSLDNRYLTEDVGVSMLFFRDVAQAVGVPTPMMDTIIHLTSVVMDTDYAADPPRTLASLGLAGQSVEKLRAL
ncbi:MAG TPA: opine dehydrogenase [Intrasporangiaceae bacterium]|nr:opine dehydrogenase [Intrasporangiaceae bacterium]